MSAKELKLEYSLSSKATCKGCKQKIEKNQLRVGTESQYLGEHSAFSWKHLDCFSLGRKYLNIDPQEISGYYDLKKEDKIKVIDHFEAGGKKNKKVVESIKDQINASEKKTKPKTGDDDNDKDKKSKPLTRLVQNKKLKARTKYDSDSSQDEESEYEGETSDDSEDDQNTDNQGSDSDYEREQISKKNQQKKKEQQKKTQKAATKQKGKLKSSKPSIGYTPEQLVLFKEYVELYEKKNAEYLKALLSMNNQTKTGTKADLIAKCADGRTLGQIPLCAECGGGKLKFDYLTGIYKCPGYMDDDTFIHCGKKFMLDEIKREPWINDLV